MNQKFLLDTNVPSELTKLSPSPAVVSWLGKQDGIFLSVISLGEFRRGFTLLPVGKRRARLEQWYDDVLLPLVADRVLPVTRNICERWALLSTDCEKQGYALGLADGLIAATAIEHGLTLATRNVKDFAVPGLTLLNPWDV